MVRLVRMSANMAIQLSWPASAANRHRFACGGAFTDEGHLTPDQGSTEKSPWPSVQPPSEAACGRLRVENTGRCTRHRPRVRGAPSHPRRTPQAGFGARLSSRLFTTEAAASGLGRRLHRGPRRKSMLEYQAPADRIVTNALTLAPMRLVRTTVRAMSPMADGPDKPSADGLDVSDENEMILMCR